MQLSEIATIAGGVSQARIKEVQDQHGPAYHLYTQSDLENDLVGIADRSGAKRRVRTEDAVTTLKTGDLVFSLLSGKAAIVCPKHDGYLFTQNYAVIIPSLTIDAGYLAYLLNEGVDIKRQLLRSQQGTSVIRYTISQLSKLELPELPSLEVQHISGELYRNQLKLESLRTHRNALETKLILTRLKEVARS